jgi:hypothetical protein
MQKGAEESAAFWESKRNRRKPIASAVLSAKCETAVN